VFGLTLTLTPPRAEARRSNRVSRFVLPISDSRENKWPAGRLYEFESRVQVRFTDIRQ